MSPKQIKLTTVKLKIDRLNETMCFEVQEVIVDEKPKTYKSTEGRILGIHKSVSKADESKPVMDYFGYFTVFSKSMFVDELKKILLEAYTEYKIKNLKELEKEVKDAKAWIRRAHRLKKKEGLEID